VELHIMRGDGAYKMFLFISVYYWGS